MSSYKDCSEASRRLLEEPDLVNPADYGGIAGIFTEIDVILLASKNNGGFRENEWSQASRDASQVMNYRFGQRQAVRYGPVHIPGAEPDYLRADGKIVYAHPDGPTEIHTPNGVFQRLSIDQDTVKRAGRRERANRTDLEPWAEQFVSPREVAGLKVEIARLQRELEAAREQLRGSMRLTSAS